MTPDRSLHALALTACALGMTALAACDSLGYGADFDYPSEPPLPPGTTVIAKAKGWDDDDPMRGREVVIDVGSSRPAELVAFYRRQFPSARGWLHGTPDLDVGGDLLCLVSHSSKKYDEYVEIYPYRRRFKSAGPDRYIASISRLHAVSDGGERTVDQCGLASIWFPVDL